MCYIAFTLLLVFPPPPSPLPQLAYPSINMQEVINPLKAPLRKSRRKFENRKHCRKITCLTLSMPRHQTILKNQTKVSLRMLSIRSVSKKDYESCKCYNIHCDEKWQDYM